MTFSSGDQVPPKCKESDFEGFDETSMQTTSRTEAVKSQRCAPAASVVVTFVSTNISARVRVRRCHFGRVVSYVEKTLRSEETFGVTTVNVCAQAGGGSVFGLDGRSDRWMFDLQNNVESDGCLKCFHVWPHRNRKDSLSEERVTEKNEKIV